MWNVEGSLCLRDSGQAGDCKNKSIYYVKEVQKLVTVVEGLDPVHLNETASRLKHGLACGGTAKDGVIVLQGNHKKRIPELLVKLGYPKEIIEVK